MAGVATSRRWENLPRLKWALGLSVKLFSSSLLRNGTKGTASRGRRPEVLGVVQLAKVAALLLLEQALVQVLIRSVLLAYADAGGHVQFGQDDLVGVQPRLQARLVAGLPGSVAQARLVQLLHHLHRHASRHGHTAFFEGSSGRTTEETQAERQTRVLTYNSSVSILEDEHK